ncbi:MAG: DNA-processing protein DprA [Elusimicrobia bacterium]|nr:DNA-processing protein DprA [Elusimicrobiota bacterium]
MNFSNEDKSIIALNLVPHLGYGQFQTLINSFGSASNILEVPENELLKVPGISQKLAKGISEIKNTNNAEKEITDAERIGARVLTYKNKDYPEPLKNLSDYPPVIYVLGSLLKKDFFSVAIVGTRKPTPYGISAASFFAAEFARSGIACISGLARGIDTEVHKSCIKEKGRTIAVLGNGLNKHYPPENKKLEEEITKNGALISEFPLNSQPDKENFPRRNRIIAAMSLATLVIEADIKSGSLITAKHALDQGKDIFAVPGPIFSKYSKGTNSLIKSGAHLAESADDIIDEINPFKKLLKEKKIFIKKECEKSFAFGNSEQKILNFLENELNGTSIDNITQKLDIPSKETASSLLGLELKGLVRSLPGKIYIKTQ